VSTGPSFEFVIEPLRKQHRREGFSCGNDDLDRYLHLQAGQDSKRHIAAPFVLVNVVTGDIAGFYTLSMSSVGLKDLPGNIIRKLPKYPYIPAVLLGRLAVDLKYRGKRLGEYLLMDALDKSLSNEIAAYCIVVDAKDESAVAFYKKYGFIQFSDCQNRLFLPMKTVEKLFES
jgi:GNAT superfamily N-acetyltransferase